MENQPTTSSEFEQEPKPKVRHDVPYLVDRIKALVVDTVIVLILMMIFSKLFGALEYTGENARIYAWLSLVLYEPVLVSMGGTLGHRMMKMTVRNSEDESKKIALHWSVIRYVVKLLLGWLSLLTVTQNSDKRAIHDMASWSIIIRTHNA